MFALFSVPLFCRVVCCSGLLLRVVVPQIQIFLKVSNVMGMFSFSPLTDVVGRSFLILMPPRFLVQQQRFQAQDFN